MPNASQTQVLIAGAGPIGLTAAIELTRRGIDCRFVDPLSGPSQYAKAVGVQPRMLEVFESIGALQRILSAAIQMHGQIVYVNGENGGQIEFTIPSDVPFGFIARVCSTVTTHGGPSARRSPAETPTSML